MNLVVQIDSGVQAGRRRVLLEGQQLQIGSRIDCDILVADPIDVTIRGTARSFVIHCVSEGRHVLVNGLPCSYQCLNDGDVVQIRELTLSIRLRGQKNVLSDTTDITPRLRSVPGLSTNSAEDVDDDIPVESHSSFSLSSSN